VAGRAAEANGLKPSNSYMDVSSRVLLLRRQLVQAAQVG
jgi:hypothetical protein